VPWLYKSIIIGQNALATINPKKNTAIHANNVEPRRALALQIHNYRAKCLGYNKPKKKYSNTRNNVEPRRALALQIHNYRAKCLGSTNIMPENAALALQI
jgi:hypothetical protein